MPETVLSPLPFNALDGVRPDGARATVLVVDDCPVTVALLSATLGDLHDVRSSRSALEGLAMARRDRPDLILLDVTMPEMDGYHLCVRLKTDIRTRDIPVVFISGRSDDEDEAKGLEVGAIDYITKPINPAIVRARVRNHLERRRAETALRRAHTELEDRVAERTRALTEEIAERKRVEAEMLEAKTQAERANRAKSEFLSHMSHELRTPLNAIIGFSEFVLSEPLGPIGAPVYREYLAHILGSGHHLLAEIEDILELASLETGRVKLAEERVTPRAMVAAAIEAVGATLAKPGLQITDTLDGGEPALWADRRALSQVLRHLLFNAVKFTPAGGRITISTAGTDGGGLEIAVADTGVGIPSERLGGVMEAFHPGGTLVTRTKRGLGLGLPLGLALMRLHNGDLRVASRPGAGTTVILRFPPERVLAAAA